MTSPENVSVTTVPGGNALNISWDPNGTNATSFHVFRVVEGFNISDFPVDIGTVAEPWVVHRGLTDYREYTYVVVSNDESGRPISSPSKQVTGIPYPLSGDDDMMRVPLLDPMLEFVRSRSVTVTGSTLEPGTMIEVVTVPLLKGLPSNHTIVTDAITGRFSVDVTVSEGKNLIHARALPFDVEEGFWSEAIYVTLDLVPPFLNIMGLNGTFENGSIVYLSAEGSSDESGIASVDWHMRSPINLTVSGLMFSFAFHNVGVFPLTVTATDLAGNSASENLTLIIVPYDVPPRLVKLPEQIKVYSQRTHQVNMSHWVVDEDDPVDDLQWFVSGGNVSLFTTAVEGCILSLSIEEGNVGDAVLYIEVKDPAGKSDGGSVHISVDYPPSPSSGPPVPVVPILLAVIITLLTAGVGARRWVRHDDGVEDADRPFFIRSLYYIHLDGRLIMDFHVHGAAVKDSDTVSSMFTAIQDFVKTAFMEEGSLENLIFAENHLTVIRGKHTYLVILSFGSLVKETLRMARGLVNRTEAELAGIIEEWDGSYSRIQNVEGMFEPLIGVNKSRTLEEVRREALPSVFSATPSVDFHHGFVRYQLELKNTTEDIVIDPHVDIEWDRQVLHLMEVTPEGALADGRFRLDNVPQDEARTLTLIFDPQTCLESFIRGSLTWTDIYGRLNTQTLDSTLVDINCPVFFTVGNANTATLQRLIKEELPYKDNAVYRFSSILDSSQIFNLTKSVVGSYDIKFVKDYKMEEPFIGEAWYYGETKVNEYKVVVRAIVREEDQTVEFFVASTLKMTITGLLAELGQLFLMKMDDKYTRGYNVYRIVKRLTKSGVSEDYLNHPGLFNDIEPGPGDEGT